MNLGKFYRLEILVGCLMTLPLAYAVIFFLYLPTLLQQISQVGSHAVFLAMTLALVWSVFILPFCGKRVDLLEKHRVFFSTCLTFAAGAFCFSYFYSMSFWILLGFMVFYQTMIALLSASYFPLIVGLYPPSVRYTGFALCYNLIYSMAGCLPIGMSFFLKTPLYPWVGILGLLVSLAFGAASVYLAKYWNKRFCHQLPSGRSD